MDAKVALLERVPLFAGLGPSELETIARIAEEQEKPAGSVLTHEGRHEGYFFIIVSGTVRIERAGQIVDTIAEGGFLGEIALLDGGPRTATAIAETPCRILVVTVQGFQDVLEMSPSIRMAIMEEVGRRLRRLDAEAIH